MKKENKSYEYINANGENFRIVQAAESTMAYINGSYVAQAETDKELEAILDHFSHADVEATKNYFGIKKATD